jgi:hypothetical protein
VFCRKILYHSGLDALERVNCWQNVIFSIKQKMMLDARFLDYDLKEARRGEVYVRKARSPNMSSAKV